jgi:hypothetical protein
VRKTERNAFSTIEELVSVKKMGQKQLLQQNSMVTLSEDGLLLADKVLVQPKSLTLDGATVPMMFVARVLCRKSRLRALAFLERAKKLNLTNSALQLLLRKAGFDGVARAERLLTVFEQDKPKGEPRLFIDLPLLFDRPPDTRRVALCGDEDTFNFIVGQPPGHYEVEKWLHAQKLPVNVYGHGMIGPFRISEEEYREVQDAPAKFFKIMRQLQACGTHVQDEKLQKYFRAFFTDRQNAQKSLDKLWSEVESLDERNRLYDLLCGDNVLRFSNGYLTLYMNLVIHISDDGKVSRFQGNLESRRRAVCNAIKNGKLPKNMEREHEKIILREVCNRLKDIVPGLALIILP